MVLAKFNRREMFRAIGLALGQASCAAGLFPKSQLKLLDYHPIQPTPFSISVSERSLRHAIKSGELEHLDFAKFARQELEINAVDYASSFFREYVADQEFLNKMNRRAADEGVRHVLLLIEDEGNLMAADESIRQQAIERHRLWIDAAATLGCRGVRVHLKGNNPAPDSFNRAVESIKALAKHGDDRKIHLLIGNEEGIARDPAWLRKLVSAVDSQRLGAFPYFLGKPSVAAPQDPYKIISALMPIARGVCATSRDFDENGLEKNIDFPRVLDLVTKSGYRGYISAEYQIPESEITKEEELQATAVQQTGQATTGQATTGQATTGQVTGTDQQADEKSNLDQKTEKEANSQEEQTARPVSTKFDLVHPLALRELNGIKATLKLLKTFQERQAEKSPQ